MAPRRAKLSVVELGVVDYDSALALQAAMVAARHQTRIGDTLILLEHPDVFTLGRGADERFILNPPASVPIRRVSRGGQVTYHGPGQLVGYPILKLEGAARDVGKYLRDIEGALIDALAQFGIVAERRSGMTGVWVDGSKIASIGVGIRRWVTFHGFALNVATDLSYFDAIVPCGIQGCRMTSIFAQGHPKVAVRDFAAAATSSFGAAFGYEAIEITDPSSVWNLFGLAVEAGQVGL